MARETETLLDNGAPFPALAMSTVAYGRLELPSAFANGYGVLLIYRAHW